MLIHGVKSRNSFPTLYFVIFTFFALTALFLFVVNPFGNSSDNAASSSSYSVYRSQQNRFVISYPTSWQISGGNEEAGVTTISSNVAPTTQEGGLIDPRGYRANQTPADRFSKIDVLSFEVSAGTTALEFLTSRTNVALIGDASKITVDGVPAIRLDVDTGQVLKNHTVSNVYTSVYLTKGNRGYIIAGFAHPEVLNQIINSFQAW